MTGQGTAVTRWHWRNWSVLVKLVAVLLVPTLVALVVGVLRIVDQAGAAPGYLRISQISDVQQRLSELVGAVQRERELVAAFVAAGRSGDQAPLEHQFEAVQTRSADVQTAAERIDGLESTGYREMLDQLRGLRPLRESALTGTEPAETVITEYGAAIDPLIALDAALLRELHAIPVSDHAADDAAAVHALMICREQVGRQQTIIAAAQLTNHMQATELNDTELNDTELDELRAAGVRWETGREMFTAALNPAERDGYVARFTGDAELSRQRLLRLVLDQGDRNKPLDISPDDWQARNASVVEGLASIENELRQRIERNALALRADTFTLAGWNAAALTFLLVLGFVIAVLIARSILRPLGVLKHTALNIAGQQLPAAVTRVREGAEPDQTIEPVAVGTQEEIGQLARAFDEVHRQAVRLAGEQARLRTYVNDMFVNLSRRSQSLVERQLQLIDRLERAEQDPEALGNLFQLDHLATRMRRNNDNLLVLADAEAAKRSSRPVRLIDVLRAAVSEVEQYQRVALRQTPGVLVLGRAAGDLVHLLAELLDNATQFSPPDTQVTVSAQVGADDEVMIEVVDRGVGMTELELAEANDRLASTPVMDASVSRRMGLFVVGRLAVRNMITVRLHGGANGLGLRAAVLIPARLVRSAPDDDPYSAIGVARALTANDDAVPGPVEPVADHVAEPVVDRAEEPGPVVASSGHLNGVGRPAGSNGDRPAEEADQPQAPLPPQAAALPPQASLPRRIRDRSAPAGQPPAPPAPQSPPLTKPSVGSAVDLFQPSPPREVVPPAETQSEVTLRHSTPIFDDVATAWFREHHAVPVHWATDAPDQPADGSVAAEAGPMIAGPAGEVCQDALVADAVDAVDAVDAADAVAESPSPDTDGSADVAVGSVPAAQQNNAQQNNAQQNNWGAGDDGWRAAQALVSPMLSAEITAMGLPRRTPRALLVPGTAGGSVAVETSDTPVRSAELIRGRLASYQQGLRDGRQACRSGDQDVAGQHQQDAE